MKPRSSRVQSRMQQHPTANEAKIQPCAEQDAAAPYSEEFSEGDLVFECDISASGNCDVQLAEFERRIDALLTSLEQDVFAKSEVYTNAKSRCDAAKAAIVVAEDAEAQARQEFQNQREQCMQDHESRQVSICVFGRDLTSKCSSKVAFEELDAEIDGANTPRSESDRQAEFEATSITKCMLQSIVDTDCLANVNLDAETLNACGRAVNYADGVGVLQRHQQDFAALTTPEKFTCGETAIPFSGFNWVVPESTEDTVVTSSQYEKIDFSVPVGEAGGSKFDFCAVQE